MHNLSKVVEISYGFHLSATRKFNDNNVFEVRAPYLICNHFELPQY